MLRRARRQNYRCAARAEGQRGGRVEKVCTNQTLKDKGGGRRLTCEFDMPLLIQKNAEERKRSTIFRIKMSIKTINTNISFLCKLNVQCFFMLNKEENQE